MNNEERAFVRGFAAATAQTVRHQTMAVDMLRSIAATTRLLKEAKVDEFDLVELRPAIRERNKRARRASRQR